MLRVVRRLALMTAILSVSCAEPPNKEMNQAQGAIDAARAAGADKFAAAEFAAAQDALKRSEEAVAARDYRQGLTHGPHSRARAKRRQDGGRRTRRCARPCRARHLGGRDAHLAGAIAIEERRSGRPRIQ